MIRVVTPTNTALAARLEQKLPRPLNGNLCLREALDIPGSPLVRGFRSVSGALRDKWWEAHAIAGCLPLLKTTKRFGSTRLRTRRLARVTQSSEDDPIADNVSRETLSTAGRRGLRSPAHDMNAPVFSVPLLFSPSAPHSSRLRWSVASASHRHEASRRLNREVERDDVQIVTGKSLPHVRQSNTPAAVCKPTRDASVGRSADASLEYCCVGALVSARG